MLRSTPRRTARSVRSIPLHTQLRVTQRAPRAPIRMRTAAAARPAPGPSPATATGGRSSQRRACRPPRTVPTPSLKLVARAPTAPRWATRSVARGWFALRASCTTPCAAAGSGSCPSRGTTCVRHRTQAEADHPPRRRRQSAANSSRAYDSRYPHGHCSGEIVIGLLSRVGEPSTRDVCQRRDRASPPEGAGALDRAARDPIGSPAARRIARDSPEGPCSGDVLPSPGWAR